MNTSIFSKDQTDFLFSLTKKVAARQIPDQNEFLKIFIPALTRVINSRDRETINNLFIEAAQHCKIPYIMGISMRGVQ